MIALLAWLCMGQQAWAENQPPTVEKYPVVKTGGGFSYVDGVFLVKCNHWKVAEISPAGLLASKCGDNTVYVTADSGNPVMSVNDKQETVARFTPYYPDIAFPLFVGRKWVGKYNGQEGRFIKWSGDLSCTTTAFEPVQVAAGKFDAFRIECVDKWDAGAFFVHGTTKSTRWYAPSVNFIIKSVNEDAKWNYEAAALETH
jgi:hypothetical protein